MLVVRRPAELVFLAALILGALAFLFTIGRFTEAINNALRSNDMEIEIQPFTEASICVIGKDKDENGNAVPGTEVKLTFSGSTIQEARQAQRAAAEFYVFCGPPGN